MEPKNNILFEAYLKQELSETEKIDFEKRLNSDSEFKSEFEEFKELYQVLENHFSPEREEFVTTLKETDASFKYKEEKPSKSKLFKLKPWHYAVAACFIIFVDLFFFGSGGKPSYADFYIQPDVSLTVRGADQTLPKKAEKAFKNEDYKDAVVYFDKLLKESPEKTDLKFYKAIALTETSQFSEADKLFKEISEGDSAYASKATWRYALSKLKQKDYKSTKRLLKKIKPEASEYDQAQKLLKKL